MKIDYRDKGFLLYLYEKGWKTKDINKCIEYCEAEQRNKEIKNCIEEIENSKKSK